MKVEGFRYQLNGFFSSHVRAEVRFSNPGGGATLHVELLLALSPPTMLEHPSKVMPFAVGQDGARNLALFQP